MRRTETTGADLPKAGPRVFMMDLWATVPYYTAYLSRALLALGVKVQIGSITYYLDRQVFTTRGLRLDPGLTDQVGRRDLPRMARRVLKLAEGALNLAVLTVRFSRRSPDIVHVQFLPLLRSRLPLDRQFVRFCQRRGARVVLTVHDLLPHDTGQRFRTLYAGLYGEMDSLICHSAHVRSRLIEEFGIAPEKISVIPHGPFFYDMPTADKVDVLRSLGVAPGQSFVLWQGILFPYKGVDLLLEAWQRVESVSKGAALVILGTGAPELLTAVEQQVKALGLQRVRLNFRFCSAEELVAAYRAATVVVYPYRAITTSGALATGLALGKSIVASDLPVFRELLTDGESALLVAPQVPENLGAALLRLLDDPALRERLSHNVQAMRFGDQSWTAIGEATLAVYNAVLSREPKATRSA